jgi:hypothetical protein
VAKCAEPVVWERSMQARYGRRVLRIGIASQHFNDVTRIHATSDLTWASTAGTVLVHPRAMVMVLGTRPFINLLPTSPKHLARLRLSARNIYWYTVGLASPIPKLWLLSYGGSRLRRHRKYENRLAGLFLYTLNSSPCGASLDFSWNLAEVKANQERAARAERQRQQALRG